jgi:hypothetical protein
LFTKITADNEKLTLLLSFFCNLSYKAQDRVINPGVPLLVAADARAAGMY